MKKCGLIFLSLVFVFVVSCTADDPDLGAKFREAVAGKSGSSVEGGADFEIKFNEDGRTVTLSKGIAFPSTDFIFSYPSDGSDPSTDTGNLGASYIDTNSNRVILTLNTDNNVLAIAIPEALIGLSKDYEVTLK